MADKTHPASTSQNGDESKPNLSKSSSSFKESLHSCSLIYIYKLFNKLMNAKCEEIWGIICNSSLGIIMLDLYL